MLDVKPFDREDDNEWLGTSEEEIRKYAERTYSIIKVLDSAVLDPIQSQDFTKQKYRI